MTHPLYAATANELERRILALPRDKVLALRDAWGLFDIGLKCNDLDPSLAQAQAALASAQRKLRGGA